MYLTKQGSQILSILIGTITLSKLFILLVLEQVFDNIDKGTSTAIQIVRDIIDKVWRCTVCNDCFYDIENFQERKCVIINNNDPKREFSWIVPVCGLLHLEMNVSKSFAKVDWEVFTNLLGITLGFTSSKAQKYLKKGSQHHKLWHYLEILYVSLGMELALP